MAGRVARNTTQALRHDLFSKSSYLSWAQIDEFTIPSLESRLTSDTYNIHQMIGMMQRLGVRAPILLIGGIMLTFTLEPVLTLVLICVLPFVGYLDVYKRQAFCSNLLGSLPVFVIVDSNIKSFFCKSHGSSCSYTAVSYTHLKNEIWLSGAFLALI